MELLLRNPSYETNFKTFSTTNFTDFLNLLSCKYFLSLQHKIFEEQTQKIPFLSTLFPALHLIAKKNFRSLTAFITVHTKSEEQLNGIKGILFGNITIKKHSEALLEYFSLLPTMKY